MNRRQFLLFLLVVMFTGSGAILKKANPVTIRKGWVLLESDLE